MLLMYLTNVRNFDCWLSLGNSVTMETLNKGPDDSFELGLFC